MPNTRKKVIKTVYKDEDSDDAGAGDFSASESDAQISEQSSSEDDVEAASSEEEFKNVKKKAKAPLRRTKKPFAKEFINKISKQAAFDGENEEDVSPTLFTVKDLTDEDKLLPSVLNLSESDSSDDDESHKRQTKKPFVSTLSKIQSYNDSDNEGTSEYKDVWSHNFQENSEEIAKKAFMELEKHKTAVEETKTTLKNYVPRVSEQINEENKVNVNDLLALGEEVSPQKSPTKKKTKSRRKQDSDSEVEDWEEVKESKSIPTQGLQLVVELPDSVCRKTKIIDVEMMMKRKLNRVKKEHQVFMHKVHVLCWLGHGNYVSRILNDQEVLAATLAMVPKGCYPEERLTIKYVEDVTKWYKDKITIKQDKNENKFRPKAPPLKTLLLDQIKTRKMTSKKYAVFVFVSMVRALGLQCRVMFNFVTLPLKPPTSELCSLSTKPKGEKSKTEKPEKSTKQGADKTKDDKIKSKSNKKIPQLDGIYDDSSSDREFENIMQLDGNDDTTGARTRTTRSSKAKNDASSSAIKENEDVSPPKRSKKDTSPAKGDKKVIEKCMSKSPQRKEPGTNAGDNKTQTKKSQKKETESIISHKTNTDDKVEKEPVKPKSPKVLSLKKTPMENNGSDKTENIAQPIPSSRRTRSGRSPTVSITKNKTTAPSKKVANHLNPPDIVITDVNNETNKAVESEYFSPPNKSEPKPRTARKRSQIVSSSEIQNKDDKLTNGQSRPKSEPRKSADINKTAEASKKGAKQLNSPDIVITSVNNQTKDSIGSEYFSPPNKGEPKPRTARKRSKTATSNEILKKEDKETVTKAKSRPKSEPRKSGEESKYFNNTESSKLESKPKPVRKRSHTATVNENQKTDDKETSAKPKTKTKSEPEKSLEKSKYFEDSETEVKKPRLRSQPIKDEQRVSHRDLAKQKRLPKASATAKNDVTGDLVGLIKNRIKEAKQEAKSKIVKGKVKVESDDNSDYLSEEEPKPHKSESDEDFKPTKISPRPVKLGKPSTSKKIDRRVLSTDEEVEKKANRVDVWCELYVEELEQWISVDVINGKIHCPNDIYAHCTHPVCYIVGWDNNNYLKDLTRRYVPHWNTVTRKQRAEPDWWNVAIQPWLGPKTAKDREEDEQLDMMQLEAPLPKSISEYKNHPLYALKRHLLKFEAIYPADAATLGFVRGEPVYARECVYVCKSRDIWLKDAKVVKLGEQPYKIVTARPKWDRLSNKLIKDKLLELFGPWQVQDYEPPVAENGIVPRNAYGNVELFKDCMLPKGTVVIKLPGLNKVAKKLNIDCAPAMTGFDYHGGWAHPVYDGFVVCKEYEEIITEAWVKDQEDQERRDREKIENRVYGNWKRLIKGLLIKERLKLKYGFEEPTTSETKKEKAKGPRLVVKKK